MSGRTLLGELGRLELKSEGIVFKELAEMQGIVSCFIRSGCRLRTSQSTAVACHVDYIIFGKYTSSKGS